MRFNSRTGLSEATRSFWAMDLGITVRKAILDLVEEGWLVRQQGKGTFVKSPKLKRELIAVNGYSEFMESTGKKPKHQILSHEIIEAPKSIAQKLRVDSESPVLELKRILFHDDQPLSFEIAHYPLSIGTVNGKRDAVGMHYKQRAVYRLVF